MIDGRDLQALAVWCHSRGLCWLPGRADEGAEALLLEPLHGHRTSESMLLVHDRDGFCLIDPLGVMLASASDLPSLLDALDGGIAEATRHQADHATPGFAAEPSPRFRVSVAA